MAKIIFFGADKPLKNLIRYEELKTFISEDDLILIPEKYAYDYKDLRNVKSYTSNWTQFDTDTFHLYLYLCNFLNRRNRPLNMKIRVRFFGAYKIKSIKLFVYSLKTFVSTVNSIDWRVLLTLRKKLPEEIVNSLRAKNLIGKGDIEFLDLFLKNSLCNSVLVFGSFKEPQIIDLSKACLSNKKKMIAFPDCWDNISTTPCLPTYVTRLLVWSEQQMKQVMNFFPEVIDRAEIIGTYRFSEQKKKFLKNTFKYNSPDIDILYLESSIYEDLGVTLINLMELITEASIMLDKGAQINLLIRRYPEKKQSEFATFSTEALMQNLKKYLINVDYSTNSDLTKDLEGKDLVFSEITTAGLEAAFSGIPTIFVKSKKSPRFLDTRRCYKYAFSSELINFFYIIDLTEFKSNYVDIIKSIFSQKILNQHDDLNISYFGVPFEYRKWNEISKSLN